MVSNRGALLDNYVENTQLLTTAQSDIYKCKILITEHPSVIVDTSQNKVTVSVEFRGHQLFSAWCPYLGFEGDISPMLTLGVLH